MDLIIKLNALDLFIIVAYMVGAFGIGVYYSRRASRSMSDFFIADRTMSWWLAGTSIVATTFAVDTPLAIAGFVRSEGIYANWFWWCLAMGSMLCVFFYARLWRRAEVVTDVEFLELRYGGKEAGALRGFMAVYGGVLFNAIVMGWVLVAMIKLTEVLLGWDKLTAVTVFTLVALGYTVMSGYWGVVMTDFFQFIIAMAGSISLMVFVLIHVGGPTEMVTQIRELPAFDPKVFHFVPSWETAGGLIIVTFLAQVLVQWWPKGQGDGYLAQRLFSTRNEEESALAALWFSYACYVLRPWPWIVVGLASLIYFPVVQGEDPELAYPMMISKFLPFGFRGLMIASLLAAFMSTMDTQFNWGASYLVNDLYRRFIKRDGSEQHYVFASRVAVILLAILGAFAAWQFDSIFGAWKYLAVLISGTGPVILLRWYWWRINIWSEISGLIASFIVANGGVWADLLHKAGVLSTGAYKHVDWFYRDPESFGLRLVTTVVVCAAVWLPVTFLTRPVQQDHLERFFRRVRPGGWWGPVAAACPDVPRDDLRPAWIGWITGVTCIYTGLFGLGYLCLGEFTKGIVALVLSFLAGWVMLICVRRGGIQRTV
jgi:SSS family solute:Na+ symporter